MANTSDLSRGLFIRHQGQLCRVVDYKHTMPGKGGAFYQVKMKKDLAMAKKELMLKLMDTDQPHH